jgi:hypothetical protein
MVFMHGLADRQLLRGLLVRCVIGRAGDFLHGAPPRALDLREKWRRSYRKRRHFSASGDDINGIRICRSANPCFYVNTAHAQGIPSADYSTFKTSHFAPYENFALLSSCPRRLAIIERVLRKNKRNGNSRKSFELQTWFHSICAPNPPKEATDLERSKFP